MKHRVELYGITEKGSLRPRSRYLLLALVSLALVLVSVAPGASGVAGSPVRQQGSALGLPGPSALEPDSTGTPPNVGSGAAALAPQPEPTATPPNGSPDGAAPAAQLEPAATAANVSSGATVPVPQPEPAATPPNVSQDGTAPAISQETGPGAPLPDPNTPVDTPSPSGGLGTQAVAATVSVLFPATGDDLVVVADPYWYNIGDYAQGVRTPGLARVNGVRYDLAIADNALNPTGHVDLRLSINGIVVGNFTLLPGETSKRVAFFFPPISGPSYTIRLEETNTVGPGLGSAAIALNSSSLTFYDGPDSLFPVASDTLIVATDPYWWQLGDYAQGVRTPGLARVNGVRYDLAIADNALSGSGHVDLRLSINGIVVGNFTLLAGETSKRVAFFFPPISGPSYTIRLEETNTVGPGLGSAAIALDSSPITLFSGGLSPFPATGDTVAVGAAPYWWHLGDYAQGVRTPGLANVNGVRYDLAISNNALSGSGHVDLRLSINGIVVGNFTLLSGETSKRVAFFFPPISGPSYTIRLEETNTVGPGLGSVAISQSSSSLTFYSGATSLFPATSDVLVVASNPYWWQLGDYAHGVRVPGLASVNGVRYDLAIADNALSGSGHVDLRLSINGIVVGNFTLLAGETSKRVAFFFPPISGPSYTIRLEETNTVGPGLGSAAIALDSSPITLFSGGLSPFPATGDTVAVGAAPYWWHLGDYAQGVRTPGFASVRGVRYDLTLGPSSLNTTGHVDLRLSINGIAVGTFSMLPGEMTKSLIFFFAPIGGPSYTVRLEETNTVESGRGSITIPLDTSQIIFMSSTFVPFVSK